MDKDSAQENFQVKLTKQRAKLPLNVRKIIYSFVTAKELACKISNLSWKDRNALPNDGTVNQPRELKLIDLKYFEQFKYILDLSTSVSPQIKVKNFSPEQGMLLFKYINAMSQQQKAKYGDLSFGLVKSEDSIYGECIKFIVGSGIHQRFAGRILKQQCKIEDFQLCQRIFIRADRNFDIQEVQDKYKTPEIFLNSHKEKIIASAQIHPQIQIIDANKKGFEPLSFDHEISYNWATLDGYDKEGEMERYYASLFNDIFQLINQSNQKCIKVINAGTIIQYCYSDRAIKDDINQEYEFLKCHPRSINEPTDQTYYNSRVQKLTGMECLKKGFKKFPFIKNSILMNVSPLIIKYQNTLVQIECDDISVHQYMQHFSCFAGNCLIRMHGDSQKMIEKVKKGDVVYTGKGKSAKVLCVVKTYVGGKVSLCSFDNGLKVTPYHPVLHNGEWKNPQDLVKPKEEPCKYVYDFVLNKEHEVQINGITCPTYGHQLGNGVLNHPYYNTTQVLKDLAAMPGYKSGLIELKRGCTKRGLNGRTVKLVYNGPLKAN